MMAARFDLRRLWSSGAPVAVAQAAVSSGAVPLATPLAVSSSGTLAYVAGTGSSGQDLALLDRRGRIVRRLGLPDGAYATPRGSPDGQHLVRLIETDLDGRLAPPINVVINRFEELSARVPTR